MSERKPNEAAGQGVPTSTPPAQGVKPLPAAAQRALAEAAARRAARDAASANRPKELQGRGGLDPSR